MVIKSIANIQGLTISTSLGKVLVNNISLTLGSGEILGIVGESGSGKTLTARVFAGLLPEGIKINIEKFYFDGEDMLTLSSRDKRKVNGTKIAYIPQNTIQYLHPLLKIKDQISDGYCTHLGKTKKEGLARASELLLKVGFEDPKRILNSYSWALSGGMRQRVNVAMAMMNNPMLLIADEPTTALDCTIQKQVIKLLSDINKKSGVSIVFISHDLNIVRNFCDRIIVMYAGRIVEEGKAQDVFNNPLHPYTKALIDVVPVPGMDKNRRLREIPGYVPEEGRDSAGCIFANRCETSDETCRNKTVLIEEESHKVYCNHLYPSSGMKGRFVVNE